MLGSSEDEQAAFVSNAFAGWQGIGGTKMPFLNFFLMHDFSQGMCDQFAQYYGDPNDAAAWGLRAEALAALGRTEEAERCRQRAKGTALP